LLLKKNIEPTDFADADCRVTIWKPFDAFNTNGVRIWVCKCGNGYWFQRHEWSKPNANETEMDDWIFAGFSPFRKWPEHMIPAPNMDDVQ